MARGDLIPLHRGVYVVGGVAILFRSRLFGALLACGPDAYISHRTAAAVYRARRENPYEIHVTVPGGSRRRHAGLVIHRTTRLSPADVRTELGLRVSSYERMLIDLAPHERRQELLRLILHGVRSGRLELGRISQSLAVHRGRPGMAVLRPMFDRYLDPTDRSSNLERSIEAWLATRDDIPRPEMNVRLGPYEIDFLWREHGVALEADGRPYHRALQDVDRDNRKNTWLQLHGIRVIRITDFVWENDRSRAADDLVAMLRIERRSA